MLELSEPLLGVLVAAGSVLVALVVVALVRRASRHRLTALAPAFEAGTARTVGVLATAEEGIFRGYGCRYRIESRSQYSPGGAALTVAVSSPMEWAAATHDVGSRLMTSLGLLKDIEVGDEELDALRISGSDESTLRSTFGQETVRTALRGLAATDNFRSITMRRDRAAVKWSPRDARLDDSVDVLRLRLEATVALLAASGCPPRMG